MILKGMNRTAILSVEGAAEVNLGEDTLYGTYSIGVSTNNGIQFKMISEELYALLVKELSNQEGNH